MKVIKLSAGTLSVVFLVLKLTGVVQWGWLQVFAPELFFAAYLLILLAFIGWGAVFRTERTFAILQKQKEDRERKNT